MLDRLTLETQFQQDLQLLLFIDDFGDELEALAQPFFLLLQAEEFWLVFPDFVRRKLLIDGVELRLFLCLVKENLAAPRTGSFVP